MTDPTYSCKTCDRRRNCMLHTRAEFPPDAAKKWLKKTCERKGECDLVYTCGFEPRGHYVGQSEPSKEIK